MAREICIQIPDPSPSLVITVPGVGDMSAIRDLSLQGYNLCNDARAFIQSLQPVMVALGMPLCILGCVTSITQVFSTDFPYVDPSALGNMASQCACLASFTPFGFCGMLSGLVSGILAVLNCLLGLVNDIVRLEAQIAAMAGNPALAAAAACLNGNSQKLLATLVEAFNPIVELFNAAGFLFSFVGVGFSPISSLVGSTTAELITSITALQVTLASVQSSIDVVCP